LILGGLSEEVTVPLPAPALFTVRMNVCRTVSVVLALAPVPSVAVIVVVPGLRPVASPVPRSTVATDSLLLDHVTAVPPVPVIVTGVETSVVVPLPSWPALFAPQHFTVPPDRSAQLWKTPALMAMAVVIPLTCTGVDEHQRGSCGFCVQSTPGREIPLPSCP
jgi:hypothetical protein